MKYPNVFLIIDTGWINVFILGYSFIQVFVLGYRFIQVFILGYRLRKVVHFRIQLAVKCYIS